MGDEHIQDSLLTLVSTIIFLAAITVTVFAFNITRDINMLVSERVDEKQSITATNTYDIASARANRSDTSLTKDQVYSMILGISDDDISVNINGSIVDPEVLKYARRGEIASVNEIAGMLVSSEYHMKTIYDTDDDKDYITEILFY